MPLPASCMKSSLAAEVISLDPHFQSGSGLATIIPLSMGREAIAIGGGGTGGGAHTMNEWFDCTGRDLGLKRILLLLIALAGVQG